MVAQRHQMLSEWEAMHARKMEFCHEHMQKGNAGAAGDSTMSHGGHMGQK